MAKRSQLNDEKKSSFKNLNDRVKHNETKINENLKNSNLGLNAKKDFLKCIKNLGVHKKKSSVESNNSHENDRYLHHHNLNNKRPISASQKIKRSESIDSKKRLENSTVKSSSDKKIKKITPSKPSGAKSKKELAEEMERKRRERERAKAYDGSMDRVAQERLKLLQKLKGNYRPVTTKIAPKVTELVKRMEQRSTLFPSNKSKSQLSSSSRNHNRARSSSPLTPKSKNYTSNSSYREKEKSYSSQKSGIKKSSTALSSSKKRDYYDTSRRYDYSDSELNPREHS